MMKLKLDFEVGVETPNSQIKKKSHHQRVVSVEV
jgi:hypothetical protein